MPKSDQPLFILAPPRSFTSVICGMIGQHPQMYGLPEVNLFAADTLAGLRKLHMVRPGFQHGLLRAVAELGIGGQSMQDVQAAKAWMEEQPEESTARIYQDLVEWAAPRRLVDKSPIYAYVKGALERIHAAFPDAYYLHLVRHPKPNCESMFKLREKVKEGMGKLGLAGGGARQGMGKAFEKIAQVDDPDSMWLEPHRRIMDFLEALPEGRRMRVRGEAFMSDPDAHLKAVAKWLGVKADKASIEAMKHPERSPFAKYGPFNAKFGNDPGYLEDPALRPYKAKSYTLDGPLEGTAGIVLSDAACDLARTFGYP